VIWHILLDTGVLGLITHPSDKPEPRACKEWLQRLLQAGHSVYVPEIADYELRRKLLHIDQRRALDRLDLLKLRIGYLPIATAVMLKAAELWAEARKTGIPTADPKALDADVILAAQALLLAKPAGEPSLVATTNVDHLGRFVDARRWQDIT
jgi:predicted nucleic acid-binding protein